MAAKSSESRVVTEPLVGKELSVGKEPIVVTGLGMATSLGFGVETNWERLLAGESEIRELPEHMFPLPITLPVRTGAAVNREALTEEIRRRVPRSVWNTTDPTGHLWLIAALEALEHAGLHPKPENASAIEMDPRRTGIYVGTGAGAILFAESEYIRVYTAEKAIQRDVSRFALPMYMSSSLAGQLAIVTGARGPAMTINTACSSGSTAILSALEALRGGRIDRAIAGGADIALSSAILKGFYKLGALSTSVDGVPSACRPFDTARDGLVVGEGAACLVLERADSAAARGAKPLAHLLGGASNTEAHHLLAPRKEGEDMAACMEMALENSLQPPENVVHVYAHGTGTRYNDACEATALKRVFPHRPTVSASKELLGHTLGAAGAIDSVLAVMGQTHGGVVPLRTLENPDPECPVNPALESTHPHLPGNGGNSNTESGLESGTESGLVMVESFAFGGHNTALLFGPPLMAHHEER